MNGDPVDLKNGYTAFPTDRGSWMVRGPDKRFLQGESGKTYYYKSLEEAEADVAVLVKINLPTKVIFLDFDGPILNARVALAVGEGLWSTPDPVACQLIARVCEAGVGIVVSSTWRNLTEGVRKTVHDVLEEGKLTKYVHPDWRTINAPYDQYPESRDARPYEIQEWLARHPEVTDYAILDDDHFNWTPEQEGKWYKCNGHNGLMAGEMIHLLDWSGISLRAKKENGQLSRETEAPLGDGG